MAETRDNFTWCHQLECPPGICNDTVKLILSKGLVGCLWDDISNATYSMQQAAIIRKNILLYKLKHNVRDKDIDSIRKLSKLKSTRNTQQKEIETLEDEYKQKDFAVRQKMEKFKTIRHLRSEQEARKNLLKIKQCQTGTQLRDCTDMRLVCQHLKPGSCKNINSSVIKEMLILVRDLSKGGDKKQIYERISKVLGDIDILTLWLQIYQLMQNNVEKLMKLEPVKDSCVKGAEESINIAIGKACGQHVHSVAKRILYDTRATKLQDQVASYLQLIEECCASETDISEWLYVTLEVAKLETQQRELQNEINGIQEKIDANNTLSFELAELKSDIGNTDSEVEQLRQSVQESLILLKSAPAVIIKKKEELHVELQKIAAMYAECYDMNWMKDNLTAELDIFYKNVELGALRKIMLKGRIGVYRHCRSTFLEACVSIAPSQRSAICSYFPMIHVPIYYLLECYKNLITQITYKKLDTLPSKTTDLEEFTMIRPTRTEYTTMELLKLSKVVCDKTKTEIDQFNEILYAWTKQTVQKIMEINENTVDGASFSDWLQRYDILTYMLQNAT